MKLEPIDGFKLINSFENCIRIITYVQPNLYSRLLYFKHAIDNCLVKLDQRDFLHLNSVLNLIAPRFNHILLSQSSNNKKLTEKKKKKNPQNLDSKNANLKNAIVVLNASNIELCSNLKQEISKTVTFCNQTSEKLDGYIKNIKNQKLFKDASALLKKSANLKESKSVDNENDNDNNQLKIDTICCQDFISHRIFLNKSLLNTIETSINEIKLNKIVENLDEKIKMDKEILLIYSHIKREEKYLNSYEPLQPLFRRYSLGYERVIQIWRKKCCGDNLIIMNSGLHQTLTANINPANQPHSSVQGTYEKFNEDIKKASKNASEFLQNQVTSMSITDVKSEVEKSVSGMWGLFKNLFLKFH